MIINSMGADNLILVMENCEELVIPQENLVTPVNVTVDEGDRGVIKDYHLSFRVDGCYTYMFHPENGVTEGADKVLHRLVKWKDITGVNIVNNLVGGGVPLKRYLVDWDGVSIDNGQQHEGQYVDVEYTSEGAVVTLVCKNEA